MTMMRESRDPNNAGRRDITMIQTQMLKNTYAAPTLIEYGSIVALTGACSGMCVDGVPGGMNYIEIL